MPNSGCASVSLPQHTWVPLVPTPLLQEVSQARADAHTQLASADTADKEGLHRLAWLSEQYPVVEGRLEDVADQVAPPVGAAATALQDLLQRVQDVYNLSLTKPPLAEVEAERDAAVAALVAGLALSTLVGGWLALGREGRCEVPRAAPHAVAQGSCKRREVPACLTAAPAHQPLSSCLECQPAAPSGRDVRGEVRRLIEEARRLPEMPGYVNYDPLLRDIAAWIEELQGGQADVAAARQVRLGWGGLKGAPRAVL